MRTAEPPVRIIFFIFFFTSGLYILVRYAPYLGTTVINYDTAIILYRYYDRYYMIDANTMIYIDQFCYYTRDY